jgi:hypothetical protein
MALSPRWTEARATRAEWDSLLAQARTEQHAIDRSISLVESVGSRKGRKKRRRTQLSSTLGSGLNGMSVLRKTLLDIAANDAHAWGIKLGEALSRRNKERAKLIEKNLDESAKDEVLKLRKGLENVETGRNWQVLVSSLGRVDEFVRSIAGVSEGNAVSFVARDKVAPCKDVLRSISSRDLSYSLEALHTWVKKRESGNQQEESAIDAIDEADERAVDLGAHLKDVSDTSNPVIDSEISIRIQRLCQQHKEAQAAYQRNVLAKIDKIDHEAIESKSRYAKIEAGVLAKISEIDAEIEGLPEDFKLAMKTLGTRGDDMAAMVGMLESEAEKLAKHKQEQEQEIRALEQTLLLRADEEADVGGAVGVSGNDDEDEALSRRQLLNQLSKEEETYRTRLDNLHNSTHTLFVERDALITDIEAVDLHNQNSQNHRNALRSLRATRYRSLLEGSSGAIRSAVEMVSNTPYFTEATIKAPASPLPYRWSCLIISLSDDVETEEKGITVGEQVDETKVLAILSLEWQEMLRMRSRVCNGLANCMEQMCGVALSPNAEKWYALRRELIRTDLKISQEAMKLFFATGVILLSNLRGQAHQTMREVIGIRLVAVDALNRLLLQKQLKKTLAYFETLIKSDEFGDSDGRALDMMNAIHMDLDSGDAIEALEPRLIEHVSILLHKTALLLLRQRRLESRGIPRRVLVLSEEVSKGVSTGDPFKHCVLLVALLHLTGPSADKAANDGICSSSVISQACKIVSDAIQYVGQLDGDDEIFVKQVISRCYLEDKSPVDAPLSWLAMTLETLNLLKANYLSEVLGPKSSRRDWGMEAAAAWQPPQYDSLPKVALPSNTRGEVIEADETSSLMQAIGPGVLSEDDKELVAALEEMENCESLKLLAAPGCFAQLSAEVKKGKYLSERTSSYWNVKQHLERAFGPNSQTRRQLSFGSILVAATPNFSEIDALWRELESLNSGPYEFSSPQQLFQKSLRSGLEQNESDTFNAFSTVARSGDDNERMPLSAAERLQYKKKISSLKSSVDSLRMRWRTAESLKKHVEKSSSRRRSGRGSLMAPSRPRGPNRF